MHANRNSIVEQIEVGHDTPDFANAVRSILRQTPDVILVGEMRDAETIATALTAAETGHLVLSTLHTNDTSQAVSRILDSFPSSNQNQIRQQLSLSLLAIIAQQLVPAGRWHGTLSRRRDHDGNARHSKHGAERRRPSTLHGNLDRPRRGNDQHGAVPRGVSGIWKNHS